MKTDTNLSSYLAQFFLEWKMFQTKFVKKIKIHISCSFFLVRKSCRFWDNVENTVEPYRQQMAILCMRKAGWIPKVTNTHLEYVIFMSLPLQQWLNKPFSLLRYTYFSCLYLLVDHVGLWRCLKPGKYVLVCNDVTTVTYFVLATAMSKSPVNQEFPVLFRQMNVVPSLKPSANMQVELRFLASTWIDFFECALLINKHNVE